MPRPASPNIGSRDELPDHPLWTEITRLQVLHCGVDTEDSNGPMYFAVRPTSVLLCSPHIYGYRNNPVTALRITIILLSQFPQKKKKSKYTTRRGAVWQDHSFSPKHRDDCFRAMLQSRSAFAFPCLINGRYSQVTVSIGFSEASSSRIATISMCLHTVPLAAFR